MVSISKCVTPGNRGGGGEGVGGGGVGTLEYSRMKDSFSNTGGVILIF